MIRRDIITPDRRPAWLLIPQIAHAELAGNLAEVWRLDALGSAEVAADLRMAIHRHDDGWSDWDTRPGIDPKLGRPVNFDEMRLADSLAIWTRSIDEAVARGPLVGYCVAGHFTRLLRRFDSWRRDRALEALAREFLGRQEGNMAHWLVDWQGAKGASIDGMGADVARRGVSYLQFFDAISLWFCCADRMEPWKADLTDGESWTFSPSAGLAQGCQEVRISPWPLTVDRFNLTAGGRAVLAAEYRSTDEMLASTVAPELTLSWHLRP
ncbi:MAG TPA: DUF3891 family protein [Pirellulales bacterium]|nr:DUF3891 family protein [Pirellulales bacterium]